VRPLCRGVRDVRILPSFLPALSAAAERSPCALGVDIRLDARLGLLHEMGDGPADFVRRVFLDEMTPFDGHLLLIGLGPDEVADTAGDGRTGVGIDEQLRHGRGGKPLAVVIDDRRHVFRLTFDRDVSG
jgi:hypothetical protein